MHACNVGTMHPHIHEASNLMHSTVFVPYMHVVTCASKIDVSHTSDAAMTILLVAVRKREDRV